MIFLNPIGINLDPIRLYEPNCAILDQNSYLCDLIDSIMVGNGIYYDLHHQYHQKNFR